MRRRNIVRCLIIGLLLILPDCKIVSAAQDRTGAGSAFSEYRYRLEVISASSSSRAFSVAEKLQALLEKPVYIVPRDSLWDVQIGGFNTKEETEDALTVLENLGIRNVKTIEVRSASEDSGRKYPAVGVPRVFSVPVTYTKDKISVDGALDEPAWKTAHVITNFVQSEPQDRAPATERTEVRVLLDEENIYFGFMCYDREPEKIVAYEMRRDAFLYDDDYIGIYLDTYHDNRNFYAFYTNPLGCRRDMIVTDGQHFNDDWDGVWSVKSLITPEGWIAEFKIPFFNIRFKEKGGGIWGANFHRNIRRKRERNYWIPVSRDLGRYGAMQASRFGKLEEIHANLSGIGLEIKPFAVGGVTRQYRPVSTDRQSNQGLDMRYRIIPNLRADFSYNTDFAQVEADQEIVNLTRFSIYFPEKREFFLENAGLFNTLGTRMSRSRNELKYFYSRRIGLEEENQIPILGAGKLSGRVGAYSLGVMNIQSTKKTFMDDDDELNTIPNTNFTAIRVKRDVLKQSSIGAMVLNKQSSSKEYNRLVAADGFIKIGPAFQIGGNMAKTFSPGISKKDYAGEFQLNFVKSSFSWRNSYLHIDPDFNPEMGFIRRKDIKRYYSSLYVTRWFNNRYIRDVWFGGGGTYMTDTSNEFILGYGYGRMEITLASGDNFSARIMKESERIYEEFDIRDVHVNSGTYPARSYEVEFETDESRRLSGGISYEASDYWGGRRKDITLSNSIRPKSSLNFEMFYSFNRVNHPTARFNSNVLSNRITYAFSTEMFAKSYIQWNELDKKISVNLLMNYRYKPGSDFYLVYNEIWDPEEIGDIGIRDRALLFKFTYFFRI